MSSETKQHPLQPLWPIGTRVKKRFPGYQEYFDGTIASYDNDIGFYRIHYDDGDKEDLDIDELKAIVANKTENNRRASSTSQGLHEVSPPPSSSSTTSSAVPSTRQKKDTTKQKRNNGDNGNKTANGVVEVVTSARGRRRKNVSYNEDAFFDGYTLSSSDDEDIEEKKPRGRPTKKMRKSKKNNNDDDDSFAAMEEDDNNMLSDDEDLDSDDMILVEDVEGKKTSKRSKKSTSKGDKKNQPKAKTTKKSSTGGGGEDDDDDNGGGGKKSMAESFKPMSTPLFWNKTLAKIKEDQEYLDPCGMEATDDVIDHLVGEQVLKIGQLLQRGLTKNNSPTGTLGCEKRPLTLGTACSGTDAPALALTIVQEQMERFGFDAKLHYEHKFSCEKEAFKQSYLARNFDSILYPDIVLLTDDNPRDVYGRIQPIPKSNTFVAGTSCKNFSLLHSTKRLDIEDKGCSGETFLAAVEYLMKEQPDFTIFENVIGAPWEKMQEYVTGRVLLKTVYTEKKAIQATRKQDSTTKELTFQLQDNGDIMVVGVPLQVGVRCGAVVKGFLVGENKLIDAQWPNQRGSTCTLKDLLNGNRKVNASKDTLVFRTPCTYCTCIAKVDTKNYGLPQTRMRTYMFVWKADTPDDYNDNLGMYWQSIVKHLESPVKHSLEAFILDTDHDNIRVFREALRGPPGRHSKRSVFQELDFYTSGNANVRHNTIARDKLGMDKLNRATTQSGAFGKKQIPPHYWLEYLDCHSQRELDMLDILHASAARDAESHDSYHSSFFWNISQNVSKEKHRTAVPGIAGCISPGGEFFVSNLGRPLLGCEKLLLQGIPYFRLMLSNESEVQVGDLAGNAMSLTVVGATLLAAIGCRQLRQEVPSAQNQKSLLDYLSRKAAFDHPSKGVVIPKTIPDLERLEDAGSAFQTLASLAEEAVQSSVWCTCETSGRNSDATHFLCCQVCRVSCCASCIGSHSGYQMESHDVKDTKLAAKDHNLGPFLSKLRDVAPSSLVFEEEGIKFLADIESDQKEKSLSAPKSSTLDVHRVKDLFKFTFNLQKIQRQRRKWVLYYNARDNNGVGEVIASFILTLGEFSTQPVAEKEIKCLGLKGELISYLPAKTKPLVSGLMKPCAVMTLDHRRKELVWKALHASSTASVTIKGAEPEASFRLELGLTDKAYDGMYQNAHNGSQKSHFSKAKSNGEARRWIYAENWKEWPGLLNIASEHCPYVDGVYKRAKCRQTVNQSALWVRIDSKDPMFLITKPNIGRTGPDAAVISSSISPDDFSDIIITLPWKWQPCDALVDKKEIKAKRANWIEASSIKCSIPELTATISSEAAPPAFLSLRGLSPEQMNMVYPFTSNEDEIKLSVHGGIESQKIIRSFNYLCVPSILRHVAQSAKLSKALSPDAEWKTLTHSASGPRFGFCEDTIPPRPAENWFHDTERDTWIRVSDPEDSRQYYRQLQRAPNTFEFILDRKAKSLSILCNPRVAAHFAAHFLLDGRDVPAEDNGLIISYRMADATLQSDPSYSPFKVFPCKSEEPTAVELKGDYKLYDRQQKVVTKMSLIESGKVSYNEIEMSEHDMPGSTGFSLIAKASRERQIVGGVIADAIGAGKTVISIALILQGLERARKSRNIPRKSGATLVVVPSGLINQWKSEIDKFASGLSVICIYDLKKLQSTSVKQIVEADVVVAPVDIVESAAYTSNLSERSGQKVPEIPKDIGHKEMAGVFGVWIPTSSRDPYGMGSATEMKNQRKRELSAYFTFSYLNAIEELRKKKFKGTDKGVPLEFFEWERVVVDEIHECLMSEKDFLELDWFKEKNRRASRELLGIAQKSVSKRPLVFRKAIYGLTGTPLLDSSDRVVELANLIGCTYIIGLSSHWRKLERESRRDIFLQQYLEPRQTREIRKAIYAKCQEYLKAACCRNTTEKQLEGIKKIEETVSFHMTEEEMSAYIKSQHGLDKSARGLHVSPENFDPSAGHDISVFLKQNARSKSRGDALVSTVRSILDEDPMTKIIVFADGRVQAGDMAKKALEHSGFGCTCLDPGDDVERQNELISYYQRGDVTEEDKARPRTLVLHFEHAAGLNLQTECYNLILFSPLYVGDGGTTGDPVSDASTEQQAIGRVFRPGQLKRKVFVYRLEMQGPNGEECLDGKLIRRNTDKETLDATINAAEDEDNEGDTK